MDVDSLEPLESTLSTAPTPRLSELVADADDPDPFDPEGKHVFTGTCLVCGLEDDLKPLTGTHGVFSNSFTTDHELDWGDGVCHRCAYMAGEMDYRRYHWLASEDGVQLIKKRPALIDALLDPPDGPWMVQYKDGSDFLTVLNGWIAGQRLNTSRERYSMIVDKRTVDFERERLREMIDFGNRLRDRDDAISKRALKHGPTAGDLERYEITREEYARIVGTDGHDGYAGREDWRIAVQLIQ